MTNTTQIDTVAIEAKGVVKVSEHDILVPGYNCSRLSIK